MKQVWFVVLGGADWSNQNFYKLDYRSWNLFVFTRVSWLCRAPLLCIQGYKKWWKLSLKMTCQSYFLFIWINQLLDIIKCNFLFWCWLDTQQWRPLIKLETLLAADVSSFQPSRRAIKPRFCGVGQFICGYNCL